MNYTPDQYREAAKRALQAGETAAAKRLIAAGRRAESEMQPQRSFGETLYENIIGSGEIDTPGERLGAQIGGVTDSLGRGIVRGVSNLADMPGALVGGAFEGAATLAEKAGASDDFAYGLRSAGGAVTEPNVMNAARDITGGAIENRGGNRAERIAGNVGEFLPAALAAGAPMALGVVPGTLSELAGEATKDVKVPEGVPLIGGRSVEPAARLAAAVAGPTVANAARRVVTPNPAEAARVAAADRLRAEGVQTTAGQKTGQESLKYREALSPRTTQIVANQNQQFTRAVLRRIGVDADRATPDVMNAAKSRIGGIFDDLSARTSINPTRATSQAARDVVKSYRQVTARSNISPIIRNIKKNIDNSIASGNPITGRQYKEWRSQLSKLTTGADAQLANASRGMIDVLDDAMTRSLAAARQIDDMRLFAQARREWRDYLAIETAISRAGEDAASGILSPQVMRNAVVAQGKRPYVLGQRDLGELARAGATVTGKLPQTGAFPRYFDMAGGAGAGGIAGGLAAYSGASPAMVGAAALAAGVAPAARNALSASRAGQAYLGNQLATGSTPVEQSLIPLLSASGQ